MKQCFSWRQWFWNLLAVRLVARRRTWMRRRSASVGPAAVVSRLEPRILLSAVTVNSIADDTTNDSRLTLREAVAILNDGDPSDGVDGLGGRMLSTQELAQVSTADPFGVNDTVTFDASINTQPIALGGTSLDIARSMTIEGNGAANTRVDGNGQSRVFDVASTAGDVTLRGLTISGGWSDQSYFDGSGGGVRFDSSGTLTICDSLLTGNSISGYAAFGGAVCSYDGSVNVVGSTLSGNCTAGYFSMGGAIAAVEGNVTVTGSTLSHNRTHQDSSGGGAIFAWSGNVDLRESTLDDNGTCGFYSPGGAILAWDGKVSVTDSTLVHNFTSGPSSEGGAIRSDNKLVILLRSTLDSNSTSGNGSGGGAVSVGSGVLSIDSTLSRNSTSGDNAGGGAVSAVGGSATFVQSTLSGNTTRGENARGGALYSVLGPVTIRQSTLTANAAQHAAGGGFASISSPVTLQNSIVAGNRDNGTAPDFQRTIDPALNFGSPPPYYDDGPTPPPVPPAFIVSHSLVGDNAGTGLTATFARRPDSLGNFIGSHFLPINPLLGPRVDNGGPTLTHAPLSGSLAINHGSNPLAESLGDDGQPDTNDANETPLTTDQRGAGFPRVLGGIVDMGAVESVPETRLPFPPVIRNFGIGATWREGDAPVVLAGLLTSVTDADSANFQGGILTIFVSANGQPEDHLSIRSQGSGAGKISVAGANVLFGSTIIGVLAGGADGTPLTVTFNGNATPAAVTALLKNLTFSHDSRNPSPQSRTLLVTLSDGHGGTSAPVVAKVNVIPRNDAPAIHLATNSVSFTIQDPGVVLAADATVVDPDSPDFAGGMLQVSIVSGRQPNDLLSFGYGPVTPGPLTFVVERVKQVFVFVPVVVDNVVQYRIVVESVAYTQSLQVGIVTGGQFGVPLTITFSAAATPEIVQDILLRMVTLENASGNPSSAPRQIRFLLTDGDGGQTSVTLQVNVVPAVSSTLSSFAYSPVSAKPAALPFGTSQDQGTRSSVSEPLSLFQQTNGGSRRTESSTPESGAISTPVYEADLRWIDRWGMAPADNLPSRKEKAFRDVWTPVLRESGVPTTGIASDKTAT